MRSTTRRRDLVAIAALAVAVLAVYAQVSGHEFVNYDDPYYVYENAVVQQGLTLQGIGWAFTTGQAGNWHPVTWLSHMLDSELFGGRAAGAHHVVNAVLHALNAVLLFAFLRTTTGAFWRALLVAALFALHPLRVESVAWVAERKDVLSTTFWLLTMLAYARYARVPGVARYVLVAVLLALGLMAKPMLVTMPFFLLLLDVWPLGRWPQAPVRRLAVEKLPLLALVMVSSVVTLLAQHGSGAVGTTDAIPVADRLANAVASYGTYLWQAAWPVDLACFYPHPVDDPDAAIWLPAALSGVVLLALSCWVVRRARATPWAIVGWCWYLGTAVPIVGLVQVGRQAHADRYTYVPAIGVYLLVVWGLHAWAAGHNRRLSAVRALAVAALLAFAGLTWTQIGVWRDSRMLWEHALAVTKNNFIAHHNLGTLVYRSVEDQPPDRRAPALAEAASHFRRAIEIAEDNAESHVNLALIEAELGERERAMQRLRTVIRHRPRLTNAELNLGVMLLDAGEVDEAKKWFLEATRMHGPQPARIDAFVNLGVIALEESAPQTARQYFEQALGLDPEGVPAHNGLGAALLALGDPRGAAAAFRRAAAAGSIEAANNLAWTLATSADDSVRDGAEAVRWATRCVQATQGRAARFVLTLAAAHAEHGDFEQAVRAQRAAIELIPRSARPEQTRVLQLYEHGQPQRDR